MKIFERIDHNIKKYLKENNDPDLRDLSVLLKNHDWTYEMSDDFRVWQTGKLSWDKIKRTIEALDRKEMLEDAKKIWDEIVPEEFKKRFPIPIKNKATSLEISIAQKIMNTSVLVRRKGSENQFLFLPKAFNDRKAIRKTWDYDPVDPYKRVAPSWARTKLLKAIDVVNSIEELRDKVEYINADTFALVDMSIVDEAIKVLEDYAL